MNLEIKQQEYEEVFKWLYNKENIALIKEFDITMAHDYNEPYIYYTKEIQDIFKTKAMQRMQRINQLGINVKARYEYHTRLEHSKGAYRRALEFIALNYRKSEWRNYIEQNNLKQYLIDTMIFLAVHDVGHSVLSHGIEKVIGDKNCNHELIGEKICAQNKELVKALEEAKKSNNPKIETKNYDELKNLCDGNIDFDRQDFIFRDLTYLGTIEDSTIINNINSNCSIMKIFEDGKEKSVYAYNESVIKDILKILELRKEIYKNKHYNIYQRMTDKTTSYLARYLTEKDIDAGHELKEYLSKFVGKSLEEIDVDEYIKGNDLLWYNNIIDIAENSGNENLRKLAMFCIPSEEVLIHFAINMLNPKNSKQEDYSEIDKKYIDNVRNLIDQNKKHTKFSEELKNGDSQYVALNIESEDELHLRAKQLEKTFGTTDLLGLEIYKRKLVKYDKNEPIYILKENR